MTDETKRIFNAPWFPFSRACDFHGLKRSNGSEIFSDASLRSEVNRLARLPELYDALVEAKRSFCAVDYEKDCSKFCHYFNERKECKALKWAELLRKVRDGK